MNCGRKTTQARGNAQVVMNGDNKDIYVLHIVPSMAPEWGGPATSVSGLTCAIEKYGVFGQVVTTYDKSEADALPTPYRTLRSFRRGHLARVWAGYSRQLVAYLERVIDQFDLVHIHELWHYPAFVAYRVAKRNRVPLMVSLRGELDDLRLRRKWLKKWAYRKLILDRLLHSANQLHGVSAAERRHVAKLRLRTPMFVCANGTDLPAPISEPNGGDDLITQYPVLRGKRIILYLGRVQALKGLDILARSFAAIASQLDDVALLVAGKDEDGTVDKMRHVLREAGVYERVVFTGLLTGERKRAALRGASVFALPSYSEGFSCAVVEALAAGVPVVISERCNFGEVAEVGAGFVVARDSDAFAKAMLDILSDDELAAKMASRARALIEDEYHWDIVAAKMASHYRELLRSHRLDSEPEPMPLGTAAV